MLCKCDFVFCLGVVVVDGLIWSSLVRVLFIVCVISGGIVFVICVN